MTIMKLVRGVFESNSRSSEQSLPIIVIAVCLGMFAVAIVTEFETQTSTSASQPVVFATL